MGFDEDKHIAYEGHSFRIEWYVNEEGESQVLAYAESELNDIHKGKLLQLFKVMGDHGQIYDETKFRHEGDKIYAFKPQPYRFLSFFTKGKKIIITNGFTKRQDKLPQREKSLALKIKQDYESRVKEDTYYG